MELDSFLASPRWDIIRIITEKPSSPMEISEIIGTTISFVSQQLKLLEAAGIVKKTRTGAVEKGKPRSLFSISEEMVYLVPLAKGIQNKKLMSLSREHKIIIQIWGIDDAKIQPILEKFFWAIEKYLDKIDSIVVHIKNRTPKVYFISKELSLTHEINEAQKKLDEKVPFQVGATTSTLSKLERDYLIPIYDPKRLFSGDDNLKGGLERNE